MVQANQILQDRLPQHCKCRGTGNLVLPLVIILLSLILNSFQNLKKITLIIKRSFGFLIQCCLFMKNITASEKYPLYLLVECRWLFQPQQQKPWYRLAKTQ